MSEPTGTVPDEPTTPTPGDGVVDILIPGGGSEMPVQGEGTVIPDVTIGYATGMANESLAGVGTNREQFRSVMSAVLAGVAGVAAMNFKNVGAVEGRVTSGILATPIASPTVQQPGA